MTTLRVNAYEPEQSGELTIWVVAAVVVVAIHIGLAVAYLWLRPEPEMRAEAPAIDVAFMPASNASAVPPAIDQPDPAPAKADLPEDPLPPPIPELQPPPPTRQVEAMVPPPPTPAPPMALQPEPPPPAPPVVPIEPELPPPPPVPEQATVAPAEKPAVVVPAPEKPAVVPERAPRKVTHEEKAEKRQAPPKSLPSQGAKPMRVASAPNAGVESEGARLGLESWLSEFAAQIRRSATYPAGGNGSGTAQVSVTVARNGRLVSHRLVASAGSAALDHAAMAAIERAQPFPPFPAGMAEAQITRIVPLHLRPQ